MTSMRELVAGKVKSLPAPLTIPSGIQPDDFPGKAEQPMSEMAASYLDRLREVAKHPTQKILIAGCRISNLGDSRILQNEKLILWESSNEGRWKRAPLPKDVGAVIMLRWISHPASEPMVHEAKARGILCTGVLATGDVRQLLDLAFKGIVRATPVGDDTEAADWERFLKTPSGIAFTKGQEAAPMTTPTTPAVTPTPEPTRRWGRRAGIPDDQTLTAAVRRLARLSDLGKAGAMTEEATRLLPMVLPSFPTATLPQLVKIISVARTKAGYPLFKPTSRSKPVEPATPAPRFAMPPPPVPTPAPDRTQLLRAIDESRRSNGQAAPAVSAGDPLADALKAIDTALVAVQKGGEALVQARTALVAHSTGMNEIILKQVEDRVLNALVGVRESFKK